MSENLKSLLIRAGSQIFNVQQLLTNAETENDNLKLQLNTLEAEKLQVLDELAKAGQYSKALEVKIQQLTTAGVEMEAKMADIEVQLRECREKADQKIQEFLSTIKSKERELDSKASAIGQLMLEMKVIGSDVRAGLEIAAETMRKEMDIEREAVCDRERKMEKQMEVFNFSSDDSMDEDQTVHAGEVNRRCEALSRGARISPTPSGSAALKRRRSRRRATNNNDDLTSLSEDEDDAMKPKESFVSKIKRHENKPKKFNQTF